MARVRDRRRDASVALGRCDAALRERRKVVGVNDEVRDARMLRVLLEQFFQDGDRLELVSVAHVGLRGRRLQGQRIENLYLVVVGVALRHLLHRAVVGAQAGLDVGLVMISVVSANRVDPAALAIRLRANLARLLQRNPGRVGILARRRPAQRVAEQIHRNAPIGDGATGILLEDTLEHAARDHEPVGMDHRDTALELRLHLRIAGGRETQRTKLLLLLLGEGAGGERRRDQACGAQRPSRLPLHRALLRLADKGRNGRLKLS